MQGYNPESAAARGDTRASFATHGKGPWNCRASDSKKPSRNMACTDWPAASRGMREARAGRTPGTNLSACSYSRSDKHPSVSSVPRDEMKRGAGVSPAALTISPPVPALGELPQRLRPDVSLARASARVDSQLPAAMGIAGTHAAGWDQFDGGAAMQHRSERWAQRGIARGHTKPGRVSGQEILSLPDHTEKSRPQLIANCVSRPAVKPFRPACADADSPIRDNPR